MSNEQSQQAGNEKNSFENEIAHESNHKQRGQTEPASEKFYQSWPGFRFTAKKMSRKFWKNESAEAIITSWVRTRVY